VKAQALAEVTEYGLPEGSPPDGIRSAAATPPAAPAASANQAAASGPPSYSTTNNQEAGVDELDTVKTDGRLLVTLHAGYSPPGGQVLQVVDVGGRPRLRGSLTLPGWNQGLFLTGSEAVVVGITYEGATTTRVWVVSLGDPDHPAVVRSFAIDGTEMAARMIGHSIKLVVRSAPRLSWVMPVDGSDAARRLALTTNGQRVAASSVADWLPAVTDARGARHLAECGLVHHTLVPSGLDTVSVVSIDPDQPTPGRAVTILADAETVYASPDHLFVATARTPDLEQEWAGSGSSATRTQIHEFDITAPATARYLASGEVPGFVLNQYALSEYAGYLRVATTIGAPTPPPGEGTAPPESALSHSAVSMLARRGSVLRVMATVDGLGRGQRIFAVRFIGPQGYVVTFRQLDPLYVLDLSDPLHPTVRGALEISGYSAYLHPLAPGYLLGVGGAADQQGRRAGLQLTLFDVKDAARPAKVAQAQLDGAWSNAEDEPHAFLWWSPSSLAVMPVLEYGFDGAIAWVVSPSAGIHEAGRVTHDRGNPRPSSGGEGGSPQARPTRGEPCYRACGGAPIERELVVGSRLFTTSERGVLASDLGSFSDVAWMPYGG